MKKNIIIYLFGLFLLSSCSIKQKVSSQLMAGWYAYTKDGGKTLTPSKIYELTDSMVRMNGKNIGYLMTAKSYKNFELGLEFRWNTEAAYKRGNGTKNSGVMYNVPLNTPDKIWPKGIQFQIKEGSTGDFILLDSVTLKVADKMIVAGPSVVVPEFAKNENPVGQWNKIVIKSSANGTCEQYLNGLLVNKGTLSSSKEGKILLQYEGSPIDFRNIEIKSQH